MSRNFNGGGGGRTSGGGGTLEGLGGPIAMDPYTTGGIDPCLDACCQREIEDNRRYNALQSTLRRHDIIAQTERRRRNLVKLPVAAGNQEGTLLYDEGCRCCYDPNSDGGEYRALINYKLEHQQSDNNIDNNNNIENDDPAISVDDYFSNQQQKISGNSNSNDDDDDDDNSSDDDEFDYLLDEDFGATTEGGGEKNEISSMEEQRRLELELQILTKQVALQHGYGIHRQIHPQRVLKVAGLSNSNSSLSSPPAVVLHLVDPDSVSSASLDYVLESSLSQKYPGTIFIRSGGRSTLLLDNELAKRSLPHLKESMIPALIAIKDGIAINQCPNLCGLTTSTTYNSGGGEIVDEYAVEHWLAMSGVLIKQSPRYIEELCNIRPEEEALMDYLATTKPSSSVGVVEEEEQRYDCGLESCCKTYPHEHVGIQTTEQSGLVVKEETILGEE